MSTSLTLRRWLFVYELEPLFMSFSMATVPSSGLFSQKIISVKDIVESRLDKRRKELGIYVG